MIPLVLLTMWCIASFSDTDAVREKSHFTGNSSQENYRTQILVLVYLFYRSTNMCHMCYCHLTFTALLHGWSAGRRDRTCSTGSEHRIHTHRATEILHDLGVRAGSSVGAQLQQAGDTRGGVTLDERVLFTTGRLHQRSDHRVEFVWQNGQTHHCAGREGVYPQL